MLVAIPTPFPTTAEQHVANDAYRERLALAFGAVESKVWGIAGKHGTNYASFHEMASVLREEYEEMWDEVKADDEGPRIVAELIDVAAVAMRALAQYMGLQPLPSEKPLTMDDVVHKTKSALKLLSWDELTKLSGMVDIHFAYVSAFRNSPGPQNSTFSAGQLQQLIDGGRKLFPVIFNF